VDAGASDGDEAADEHRRGAEVVEIVFHALAMLVVLTARKRPSRQHGLPPGVTDREAGQVAKHRGAGDYGECGPR
jgi:hypothetical protein